MIDEDHGRAVKLAHLLGVVQEARRLGHRVVGSEHLLLATFSDPVVRTACRGIGCDMRDVQGLIKRDAAASGRGEWRHPDREAAPADLTPEAGELLLKAEALVGGLDTEMRPVPAAFSAALCAVMITLLHHDGDTAARSILEELDVVGSAESVLARLRRPLEGPAYPSRREESWQSH